MGSVSLLCSIWSIGWEELNHQRLESDRNFSILAVGAWTGVTRRKSSVETVNQRPHTRPLFVSRVSYSMEHSGLLDS